MSLFPTSTPRINVRVLPRFPSRIDGEVGIAVQTAGGIATVRLAADQLTLNNSTDPTNRAVLSYDSASGEHERIPMDTFIGILSDDLEGEFLRKNENLSGLTNVPAARGNLGITAAGDAIVTAANAGAQRTALAISATNTPFTPAGNIAANNVQGGMQELDAEKQALNANLTTLSGLTGAAGKVPIFTGPGTMALATLSDYATLASADFTVLKRSGKDIYGALPVFASGGDESDMNTTAQTRLSVTFVAIAPNCAAETVMTSDNQGAANFAGIWLRLTDVTAGNVMLAQHATSGYVGASASMTLTSIVNNPTPMTIGSTYRIDLIVVKTIAAGPIYPRNMRISAQNF